MTDIIPQWKPVFSVADTSEYWNRKSLVPGDGPGEPPQTLGELDAFDGGDVLPGFTAPVWSFFRRRE